MFLHSGLKLSFAVDTECGIFLYVQFFATFVRHSDYVNPPNTIYKMFNLLYFTDTDDGFNKILISLEICCKNVFQIT